MQFVQLNDVALHDQVIGGPAQRPVIVFINSLGTDFRIWRDVLVRLAGDYPLLTYDKRGHGLSDVGETPYSIDDHVDDLIGLLEHLDVRRAVICGLSVGGLIAQGLYARRPDLVRALILCDTAHKIGTSDMWASRINAINENGLEGIVDGVMERWFTPSFREPGNPAFPGYRNMMLRQPVAGYTGTCAAIRDADYTVAATKISAPTLCVVGDQDGATPPDLVLSLAKLIPSARYEVIKDAGHIPCVEQPEALTAVIEAFLSPLVSGDKPHG
ncbi:3-oxoadipate enol-lactonase [Rhizobium sp. Root274]|uniref:3-oxoadipate enol-lactonase n=1 Tax=unclassified Rhizobium TaxID=2613769 RepID=UPI000715A140|nr:MULTISPECIES: 3-oxoadipate enol-lactonase [unclassified Rhizobium]KQW29544.1 3-oxoadipate enol-lactonase [Rhizobium sp. Root1240]KRD29986.1 3-oxoadipate enol-lactonase [Rhizobium sp. Root274]